MKKHLGFLLTIGTSGLVTFIACMILDPIATKMRGYEAFGGEEIAAIMLGVAAGWIVLLILDKHEGG